MTTNVTSAPAAIEGRKVYVMPDPDGLGATLDRALDAHPDALWVSVCGNRIGGKSATRSWAEQLGEWDDLSLSPIIERHDLRLRVQHRGGGQPVGVSRIEPWLGEGVEPEHAAEAFRVLRGVVGKYGTRMRSHPSRTAVEMIDAYQRGNGWELPACPPEVAELLAATSGQGRFEVFPAAAPERGCYPLVTSVDARFMYASCAGSELPVGVPVDIEGEPVDKYAAAWHHVRWEPADGVPVGILPYQLDGGRWTWPTEGKWSGWVGGAELHLARRHGYRVEVMRSIVWPERRPVLAGWATYLADQRERCGSLRIHPAARAAARRAVRALVVAGVGSLHYSGGRSLLETVENGTEGSPVSKSTGLQNPAGESMSCPAVPTIAESPTVALAGSGSWHSRPEWSTTIWALARARLARVMLDQKAPVLGATLDGFTVTGRPFIPEDRGRPGAFRPVAEGPWPEPVRTLPEYYAALGELVEVGA